ncbi:hypothetical protein CEXT_297941 [Caerostris extrusa]|uniref:Uncharacterized protein n=1 Tax=Caerostris extrusa TaxID=172846 RepID=A0AAV4TXH9_CAEEX|nr:hypothetical protein CEXT_297941 [Caerostris extrusa]
MYSNEYQADKRLRFTMPKNAFRPFWNFFLTHILNSAVFFFFLLSISPTRGTHLALFDTQFLPGIVATRERGQPLRCRVGRLIQNLWLGIGRG